MSTLKVNTIQNTSGGSSSTPEQIEQGRAKVWLHMQGSGTVAINDSFNVSSVTDLGTGMYQANFSITMANQNYCSLVNKMLTTTGGNTSTDDVLTGMNNTAQLTTSTKFFSRDATGGTVDSVHMFLAVFGDL